MSDLTAYLGFTKGRPAVNLDAIRRGGIEHQLSPAPVFLEELILTGYAEPGFVRIWAEIAHFPFLPSRRPGAGIVRASPPGSQRRSRFSGMQKRKKKRRRGKGSPTWSHFSSKCRKMEYFKGHRWVCWPMFACLPSQPWKHLPVTVNTHGMDLGCFPFILTKAWNSVPEHPTRTSATLRGSVVELAPAPPADATLQTLNCAFQPNPKLGCQ